MVVDFGNHLLSGTSIFSKMSAAQFARSPVPLVPLSRVSRSSDDAALFHRFNMESHRRRASSTGRPTWIAEIALQNDDRGLLLSYFISALRSGRLSTGSGTPSVTVDSCRPNDFDTASDAQLVIASRHFQRQTA